jgi:transposase
MGFDSDRFRASIADVGAQAVIPSSRSRSQAIPYDEHLYEERNLVERFINKIKHYRRLATRYEKTALSFAPMLFLVGAAESDATQTGFRSIADSNPMIADRL